jgi:hypothetical protein
MLINHSNSPQTATLSESFHSLLPDIHTVAIRIATSTPSTQVDLPPQGVAVLTQTSETIP